MINNHAVYKKAWRKKRSRNLPFFSLPSNISPIESTRSHFIKYHKNWYTCSRWVMIRWESRKSQKLSPLGKCGQMAAPLTCFWPMGEKESPGNFVQSLQTPARRSSEAASLGSDVVNTRERHMVTLKLRLLYFPFCFILDIIMNDWRLNLESYHNRVSIDHDSEKLFS